MGRLRDFLAYLKDRESTLSKIDARLCQLQSKYETYFTQVSEVRERELQQLSEHIAAGRSRLPAWLNQALDEAQVAVEEELEAKLRRLREAHARFEAAAEEARQESVAAEQAVRRKNVDLDRKEEALKARSQALLERLEGYNQRIRELGSGFGFFKNFFAMRSMQRERRAIDDEHEVVAAQIEAVRRQWQEQEQGYMRDEAGLRKKWTELKAKAAAVGAKLNHIEETRERLLFRSVVERALCTRRPSLPTPAPEDPRCQRCNSANPQASHFCQICAKRLGEDRLDLEGSIEEIAEVNHHFERFAEGMRACQGIIGLVRGLRSGVRAFSRSVESMQQSEQKHSLPKLRIDVPAASVQFGKSFDALKEAVEVDLSLHPKKFGEQVRRTIAGVLTEAKIKGYFETMGQELSRCAKSQWD